MAIIWHKPGATCSLNWSSVGRWAPCDITWSFDRSSALNEGRRPYLGIPQLESIDYGLGRHWECDGGKCLCLALSVGAYWTIKSRIFFISPCVCSVHQGLAVALDALHPVQVVRKQHPSSSTLFSLFRFLSEHSPSQLTVAVLRFTKFCLDMYYWPSTPNLPANSHCLIVFLFHFSNPSSPLVIAQTMKLLPTSLAKYQPSLAALTKSRGEVTGPWLRPDLRSRLRQADAT